MLFIPLPYPLTINLDDDTTKNHHPDLPIRKRHSIKGIKRKPSAGIRWKGVWRRVLLVMALEEFTAVIWTLWPWFLGAVSSGTHSGNIATSSIRNRHLPVIATWTWPDEDCLCCDSKIFNARTGNGFNYLSSLPQFWNNWKVETLTSSSFPTLATPITLSVWTRFFGLKGMVASSKSLLRSFLPRYEKGMVQQSRILTEERVATDEGKRIRIRCLALAHFCVEGTTKIVYVSSNERIHSTIVPIVSTSSKHRSLQQYSGHFNQIERTGRKE